MEDYTFAELLKMFRVREGLTQQELADLIDMSRRTIVDWESGKYKPKTRDLMLTKLSIALNLPEADTDKILKAADFLPEYQTTEVKKTRPVPLQRPENIRHFTSREKELKQLLEALKSGAVVTLCGSGGIGKTALAAEAIRKLVPDNEPPERFPDGIIIHNFYEDSYARNALIHIASSFNLKIDPETTPTAAVRRALSGKQALLILEGTENADDLEIVLGERNQCGVLITTRKREHAILGERQINLHPFNIDEGIELLKKWAEAQITNENTAEQICELVGGLPLAIRLAGSYMAWRNEDPSKYLDWLRETPLEALDHGNRRLRSVPVLLEKSVAQLNEAAIQLFQVIGLLAQSPFDQNVITEALATSPKKIRQPLDELINYSLLDPVNNRYRVSHTLIYIYARERMEAAPNIVRRLGIHYTVFAEEKSKLGLVGYAELERERPHLMAVLDACRNRKDWTVTLMLAGILDEYLEIQGHWTERVIALTTGLAAVRGLEDRHSEGGWLSNLGNAYRDLGQVKRAIEFYEQALAIAREIGNRRGEGNCLGNLGNAYRDLGQVKRAIEFYQQTLAIAQELGDQRSEELALGNLGNAHHDLGQVKQAIEFYEQALAIAREIGDQRGEGNCLGSLGNAYNDMGPMEQAIEYFEQALTISREIGDRQGESSRLSNLGNAYYNLGQVERAIEYYQQALVISQEIGDRRGEDSDLGNLGSAYRKLKQMERARELHEQALAIAREIGDRRGEGIQLGNLGSTYHDLGEMDRAIELHEQALAIAREIGDQRGEGKRLSNLGTAYFNRGVANRNSGDLEQAIEFYSKALAIARQIDDRTGEGNHLINLGEVYRDLGQVRQAIEYFTQALLIFEEIKSSTAEQIRKWLEELGDGE